MRYANNLDPRSHDLDYLMSDLPSVVQSWIGTCVVSVDCALPVQSGLWENFCAAVEDGNPLYWDQAVAAPFTGGRIASPVMLPCWGIEHDWRPQKDKPKLRTLELHFMLKDALDYPFGLVTDVEFILFDPLRDGDRLTADQVLRTVGEEKTTRLGIGREWVIDVQYRRASGELTGIQSLTCLGYRKAAS